MVLSRYSEKLEFATHNTLSCNNRHVFIFYFLDSRHICKRITFSCLSKLIVKQVLGFTFLFSKTFCGTNKSDYYSQFPSEDKST